MSDNDQERRNSSAAERSGNAARGYGDGGDTPFGQMTGGSSNRAEGGYGGDNAGGFGQQVMNAQWGQGGVGPMTQGAGYGQGGGQFGAPGRDSQSGRTPYATSPDRDASPPRGTTGTYGQQDYSPAAQRSDFRTDQQYSGPGGPVHGGPHHDEHEHHYRNWRDTQLSSHDRDYARWRDEQARKYDEDYHGWRGERHSAFSREFEGWRANRGGQSSGPSSSGQVSSGQITSGQMTSGQASSGQMSSGQASSGTTRGATFQSEQDRPVDPNAAHGANPTLANIADGHAGAHAHHSDTERKDNTPT